MADPTVLSCVEEALRELHRGSDGKPALVSLVPGGPAPAVFYSAPPSSASPSAIVLPFDGEAFNDAVRPLASRVKEAEQQIAELAAFRLHLADAFESRQLPVILPPAPLAKEFVLNAVSGVLHAVAAPRNGQPLATATCGWRFVSTAAAEAATPYCLLSRSGAVEVAAGACARCRKKAVVVRRDTLGICPAV